MIDTSHIINSISITEIIGRFVTLKKEGKEMVSCCPFHDEKTSSFKVSESKKIYKCYGCGKGGDVISFLMEKRVNPMTFHEAIEYLGAEPSVEKKDLDSGPVIATFRQVIPNVSLPQLNHYKYGIPSVVYNGWRNQGGQQLGITCRFDLEGGKKMVIPMIYTVCESDGWEYKKEDNSGGGRWMKKGQFSWRWMGFDRPRPLYNLHLITQNTSATILVVEGEKTCDALQKHLNPSKTVVTTWMGGADGCHHTNWKLIDGRNVIYWPDNDDAGIKAMIKISEIVSAAVSKFVNVPSEYPKKWDGADKEWSGEEELRLFVRENMVDAIAIPSQQEDLPIVADDRAIAYAPDVVQDSMAVQGKLDLENPPLPEKPKNTIANDPWINNDFFRMLGYSKDETGKIKYHFFSYDANCVIDFSPSSMTKPNLMMLAEINWWEQRFPGSKGLDLDQAQQFLITHSYRAKIFQKSRLRGRGAWFDDDQKKIVIHTGDKLIVDSKNIPLRSFKSKYVYEIGEKLGFGTGTPLSTADANKLAVKLKFLMWERDINADLLAGWCVVAPFCGILQWRPHIWVTGPAGSGKSWVMENITKRLVGDTGITVQGKTTEAGIRGMLQNDARPVLFDESDVDSHGDKERIQSILALARASSSKGGGHIGKGTQSGGHRVYTVQSCFAFHSIGVHLNQQADKTRFTTLGLIAFEGWKTEEQFNEFEKDWNDTFTDEYISSLQARTMSMLPVILKNSKTFSHAVAVAIGQKRIGEQVGGMLAGAYSLFSKNEISHEDAVKWVLSRDWTDEKSLELTKDENRLFNTLISSIIQIESEYGKLDRSVGEVILTACGLRYEQGSKDVICKERLRRLGILVENERIYIASNSDGIEKIIKDTPWTQNYTKILERIQGAKKESSKYYSAGLEQRGVSIPLSMVVDKK